MFDTRQEYAQWLARSIWQRLPHEIRDTQYSIARSEVPTMTLDELDVSAAEAGAEIFWEEDDEVALELCHLYAHEEPELVALAMVKRSFFRQFPDDESMRRHFRENGESN